MKRRNFLTSIEFKSDRENGCIFNADGTREHENCGQRASWKMGV